MIASSKSMTVHGSGKRARKFQSLKNFPTILTWIMILPFVAGVEMARSELSDTELRLRALEDKLAAQEDPSRLGTSMKIYFKNGIKMYTTDKKLKFQLGGRIQSDWGFFSEDSTFRNAAGPGTTGRGPVENGHRFRRARFFMAGVLWDNVIFKWDMDFGGAGVGPMSSATLTFKDMYIGLRKIPWLGTVRVGNFKRAASLDTLTSSNYLTFIERSLTNTFFKIRNTGISVGNHLFGGRLMWQAQFVKETSSRPPNFRDDGGWQFIGRLAGVPFMTRDKKKLVHLGVSWSAINPDDPSGGKDRVRYRAARNTEITARFLGTGFIPASWVNQVGLEGSVIWNQFNLQGEYVFADVNQLGAASNAFLDSFYVHGSWILTGESKQYTLKKMTIARFKPRKNFTLQDGEVQGWGMWEAAIRWSQLDLNDAGVAGGKEKSLTVGLNWHLNPMTRIMYNYILDDFDDGAEAGAGRINANVFRFQVDF